jgi:hypothetical protein
MPVGKHGTFLGNSLRERKNEAKITFWKHRSEMLRQKVKRMGNP